MHNFFRASLWALLLSGASIVPAFSQTAPPAVFFSDLESGPNSGGENNNGAYVTIYGTNFGTSQAQSSVTVGGGKVANYEAWGTPYLWYQKITFQLGPNAQTGNIQVSTPAGTSNAIPFTVRSGNIYFVSPLGNNRNPGTVSQPFQTLPKARDAMQPGDITYLRTGNWSAIDDFGAVLNIWPESSGTAGRPKALVGYPGDNPTVVTTADRAIQFINHSANPQGSSDYWVIAGLKMVAGSYTVYFPGASNHIRVVGTDLQQHNNASAFDVEYFLSDHKVYGNNIHNTGNGTDKAYAIYYGGGFGTGPQSGIDIGWNALHDNPRGKGIQIYGHRNGDTISNVTIHNNQVYNNCMSGMTLGGSDGTAGFLQNVTVYNNLIYHNGYCDPDYPYYGIQIQNQGNSGTGGGTFVLYNNTFYDNGDPGRGAGATFSIDNNIGSLVLQNNIFYANSSTKGYIDWYGTPEKVSGSNNIWYGAGGAPTLTSGNINSDPKFTDAANKNFSLQSGSPAIGAGVVIPGLTFDIAGNKRPQGPVDIGAYQYATGASNSENRGNRCDLNSDGVVNASDVQIAVAQAIGSQPCSSASLTQAGQCTVVDVQRVVNASLGQSCRTGQ